MDRAGDAGRRRGGAVAVRPLRIVHVIVTSEFAGTERYVLEVAGELAARGHQVLAIGGRPEAMGPLAPSGVGWRPGGDTATAARAMAGLGRADVVHSHNPKGDYLNVMAAPVSRGARISTRHITAHRGYTATARRLAPRVRQHLTREIAVSSWTSDQLEQPSDVVLMNGVRAVTTPARPRGRTVLVAQRLAPEKDTLTALRAWARSGLAGRGWRMTLAGAGPERPALERFAVEAGIADSVDFVGWLDDPSEAFARCGVFLAPAPTEPCGLSILEAMSHGAPVVAAGSGGHLETVGRHAHAALFPPGDDTAAAAQLVRLAGDEPSRAVYGRGLQELQRDTFTIDAHVTRLEGIYRDAVTGRQ